MFGSLRKLDVNFKGPAQAGACSYRSPRVGLADLDEQLVGLADLDENLGSISSQPCCAQFWRSMCAHEIQNLSIPCFLRDLPQGEVHVVHLAPDFEQRCRSILFFFRFVLRILLLTHLRQRDMRCHSSWQNQRETKKEIVIVIS